MALRSVARARPTARLTRAALVLTAMMLVGSGCGSARTPRAVSPSTSAPASAATAADAQVAAAVGPGRADAVNSGVGIARQTSARPVPVNFQPVSASFVTPAEGWVLGTADCAAGPCSAVVHTTDRGATWQALASPGPLAGDQPEIAGPTDRVNRIQFASELDGWAWGPALYATHDGGNTWKRVASKPVLALRSTTATVWALVTACADLATCARVELRHSSAANDLWASTADVISTSSPDVALELHDNHRWVVAGGIVYSADIGDALVPVETPCDDPLRPAGVSTADAQHVIVTCSRRDMAGDPPGAVATPGELAVSSDDGKTWRTQSSGSNGSVDQVATNGRGVVVTASSGAAASLERSPDIGRTWQPTSAPPVTGGRWSELRFVSPNDVIAVSWRRELVISHDGGNTWQQVRFSR